MSKILISYPSIIDKSKRNESIFKSPFEQGEKLAESLVMAIDKLVGTNKITQNAVTRPGAIIDEDAKNITQIIHAGKEAGVSELDIEVDRKTAIGLNLQTKTGTDLSQKLGLVGEGSASSGKIKGGVSKQSSKANETTYELNIGTKGESTYIIHVKYK